MRRPCPAPGPFASVVAAALTAASVAPGVALADPEGAALTLTPWSGTVLQFTDEDAQFAGAFSANLGHGLWGQAEMNVPLNPVASETVLVDSTGAVTGFNARVAVGWDSTYRLISLVEGEDFRARADFCAKHGILDCTDTAIEAKVAELEEDLGNYHNIRPSVEVGRHHSIALEVAGSYGGITAQTSATTADADVYSDYHLEAGPALTVYWKKAILSVRPGVGVGQDVSVRQVHTCTQDDGILPVTQVCEDTLVLDGTPAAVVDGHLRTAITLWDTQNRLSGDLAPGVEIRTNLEDLFTDLPLLNLRLTGFLGPKAWPLGLRSGIGVDVDLALSGDARFLQGVTPFAFIGATFDSSGQKGDDDAAASRPAR